MQRDVVERVNGPIPVVLAGAISRFLGGIELGHILDLNHVTLPSRLPRVALGAAGKSAESPTIALQPCCQPESLVGRHNAAQPWRGSSPDQSSPQSQSPAQIR